jgi:Restriction endonuclease
MRRLKFLHENGRRSSPGRIRKPGLKKSALTPCSGDRGRDIIAVKRGLGSIRVIDQVKAYKPNHPVTADEVRALMGVLHGDSASKGFLTTTSDFAPRLRQDPLITPFYAGAAGADQWLHAPGMVTESCWPHFQLHLESPRLVSAYPRMLPRPLPGNRGGGGRSALPAVPQSFPAIRPPPTCPRRPASARSLQCRIVEHFGDDLMVVIESPRGSTRVQIGAGEIVVKGDHVVSDDRPSRDLLCGR